MRKVFIISCVLVVAIMFVGAVFLPSLMRAHTPDETVPVLAKQELLFFHSCIVGFAQNHNGKQPANMGELLADGNYLHGVVEPHRTIILSRLEFPVLSPITTNTDRPLLAAYHVHGFGDFFLLTNGTVVEERSKDYSPASYRRIQQQEADSIRRKLGIIK